MPSYKLTIAYDGTDFHGWQKQEPPENEPLRTVQGVVEQCVRELLREPVVVVGASRTDAGVHALGQVAAFTTTPDPDRGVGWPIERGCDRLVLALNSRLPGDVLVRSVAVVPDGFRPIGGAIEKEYSYSILSSPSRPLWDRRFVFHTRHGLDAGAMRRAGGHLLGTHDFASFAQINHGRKTTVRTIFGCGVEECDSGLDSPRLTIRVRGDGFLYNMVRIVAGMLVEAGRGRIDPHRVPAILAAADRTKNPAPTLPPNGLRLEWIRY